MLKKHALYALTLTCSASLYANIPIESRGLSQGSNELSSGNSTAQVQTNPTWQLMQKNQQLENDIRVLRGKMEEQDNEIEKLKKELTNRYTDLDQRLELLQQKVDPESAASPEEDNQQDTSPSTTGTTGTTGTVNTAVQPKAPVSSTVTPAINAGTTVNVSSQLELEKAAYTIALDAYKQGGAKKAIAPMQNFIKNHPNSVYIGNAYFWLAEFNLAIEPTNYTEAKKNFNIVANQYPNSAKASNALYRLYSIAKDVDRDSVQAAKAKNKILANYPKSEEASYFKK
ncbi:tetratricopeptide repeat protein [Acinetobacter chinensis]|uniref:Tetratricopeptide repeat protein n=1 Tax=Acinetobacter chinensis TaxID=2004650 RepID=A0ABU3WF38_9GAMM|nr:YbgF trimerization domain-containing protein [Acinetobacter chinensis]MDV2469034.1 tetratricopeptide repeat protein [Acinetobacter chinensis]